MADLKLKKITIRNWMKFVDSVIEFPDSGLVLVTGINKASGGKMQSVGSGKTALGEAICRTLLGSDGRFTYPKSYSRDKKGDCYVKVEATHRGTPLIVENGYKCHELGGTGEALRYQYGDQKAVSRSIMAETRNEITAIIGVTPTLSNWTVFIRGKKIEFSDLSQEDAVKLVMASLAQPPWTQFYERSKKLAGTFRNSVDNDKNNISETLENIKSATKSVVEAEEKLAEELIVYKEQRKKNDARIKVLSTEAEAKRKSTEECNERKVAITKRLKEIEDEKAKKHHDLEIERNAIDDKLDATSDRRDKAVQKKSSASNLLSNAKDKLNAMLDTPKECPTCAKPWDKSHSEDEIKKQRDAVAKAQKAYDSANAAVNDIAKETAALRTDRQSVTEDLAKLNVKSEVNDLRDEYEEIESSIHASTRRIHAVELEIIGLQKDVTDSGVKSAEATVNERKKHLLAVNEHLASLAASVAENEASLSVINYWNKAFGPTGIPNMVLSEAIGPMNAVAKTISHRMTGGTISVTYGTNRQLSDGSSKAELSISVDNAIGSSEIAGSSNGEGGLTNFIVSETLSEVGNVSNRVGFRWYDEVVPYQDPVVAKSIYAYMREIAHRMGILVFLVDHNPVASNYADHTLIVEKSRDGTSVSWR